MLVVVHVYDFGRPYGGINMSSKMQSCSCNAIAVWNRGGICVSGDNTAAAVLRLFWLVALVAVLVVTRLFWFLFALRFSLSCSILPADGCEMFPCVHVQNCCEGGTLCILQCQTSCLNTLVRKLAQNAELRTCLSFAAGGWWLVDAVLFILWQWSGMCSFGVKLATCLWFLGQILAHVLSPGWDCRTNTKTVWKHVMWRFPRFIHMASHQRCAANCAWNWWTSNG